MFLRVLIYFYAIVCTASQAVPLLFFPFLFFLFLSFAILLFVPLLAIADAPLCTSMMKLRHHRASYKFSIRKQLITTTSRASVTLSGNGLIIKQSYSWSRGTGTRKTRSSVLHGICATSSAGRLLAGISEPFSWYNYPP